jgi:hypothetical protein
MPVNPMPGGCPITPPTGTTKADFTNTITGPGPMEGRPPGEIFAHQRWDEFFPKEGYVFTLGQAAANQCFYPGVFPDQNPNSCWTYAGGHCDYNTPSGTLPPPLIKGRYGVPMITRIYNHLPVDRIQNGGFGRNEHQLHFHNAHNGAESDGAANVHHFPGTFYDTAGAPRSPAATKSILVPPSQPRVARTAMAASSGCPATTVSTRGRCGRTTTGSSSRPRMSTKACS